MHFFTIFFDSARCTTIFGRRFRYTETVVCGEVYMKFSFTGRHMEVGESLTERAKEACGKLASKFGTEFIDANIVMKKDGYLFHCDISTKTSSGETYHAGDDSDDPNVSFDITLQKIDLQMRKKKKNCHCSCHQQDVLMS
jgi:ribosomal subunit interface protein